MSALFVQVWFRNNKVNYCAIGQKWIVGVAMVEKP